MNNSNELKSLVGNGEKVFYEGKPDFKCFIIESIFNPLLPFAIIWGLFDMFFIGAATIGSTSNEDGSGIVIFLLVFMLFHMMPVWLYLGGVLFSFRRYRNTYYIVTDKAVYASGGIFTKTYQNKPFAELSHVDLHRGIFDQMFGVGDVALSSNQFTTLSRSGPTVVYGPVGSSQPINAGITISSIKNYTEVYNLVKKLQQDIYTDVMYPNDLRPGENHGYNTEYKGQ